MSQYRDSRGRYRQQTGFDILEQYGACVSIVLALTAYWWLPALVLFMSKELQR